ncbi:LytR/AlgR family response regulator transcription factor [Pedobacter boryungensis]|uniref:Response regulator transcription factor n=1 Tax=Pedobacter boryungensis TaxID=869962 RepID=A0ABX2DAN1_9SPHI|nr:LytTR family DNA-binding domain-containing protein [Pedobacter boryungensis]NQX31077.1 response regulator transcription factor [Pedobacter boryungensis]
MIRCIVVDDKPLAIDVLKHYIAKVPSLTLSFCTTNPLEALNKVLEGEVDLVFLDIQMPELTGLQFMKIVKNKCLVVLTTAYAEFALEGFDNDAVDYLLKPVSFERFYKAVEKTQLILNGRAELVKTSTKSLTKEKELTHIFVKTEYKLVRINITDILYVEGLQNYVMIYTATGKITSLQTMKKTEDQLPTAQFIRIHKSFIVAINKINSVERNMVSIGDKKIAIGEVYRESFYQAIANG